MTPHLNDQGGHSCHTLSSCVFLLMPAFMLCQVTVTMFNVLCMAWKHACLFHCQLLQCSAKHYNINANVHKCLFFLTISK